MTPDLSGLWIVGAAALVCLVIALWPESCRCKCQHCCKDEPR